MIRKPITCENHFSCLPESIVQISKLLEIYLHNCTRLCSLPQLPSTTDWVEADGFISLETFSHGLKPHVYLFNRFKLAGLSDMVFNVLRMLLTVHQVSHIPFLLIKKTKNNASGLSLSLYIYIYMSILNIIVSRFQEIHKQSIIFGPYGYVNIVILGSEIPKWFTHQSVGNIVNAKVFFF